MFAKHADTLKFEPYKIYKTQILDSVSTAEICISAFFYIQRSTLLKSDCFDI